MNKVKNFIGIKFPGLFSLLKSSYYLGNKLILNRKPHEIIFNRIYRINAWGDQNTVSGAGSNLSNTKNIREKLPVLLKKFGIKTMLDIPCGDFFWMNKIQLDLVQYIGADLIKEIVKINKEKYSGNHRKFIHLDIIKDKLPKVDLVFCRDCLPHLPVNDIFSALKNIKESGSKYLLTSNYFSQELNTDIVVGGFRRINFQIHPFNFPEPLEIIEDKCLLPDGNVLDDKSLALWKIEELKIANN